MKAKTLIRCAIASLTIAMLFASHLGAYYFGRAEGLHDRPAVADEAYPRNTWNVFRLHISWDDTDGEEPPLATTF